MALGGILHRFPVGAWLKIIEGHHIWLPVSNMLRNPLTLWQDLTLIPQLIDEENPRPFIHSQPSTDDHLCVHGHWSGSNFQLVFCHEGCYFWHRYSCCLKKIYKQGIFWEGFS